MATKAKPVEEKKKKEILVDGVNLAALSDEKLLEFQKQYDVKLGVLEKDNALLEVEVNMLRNAWKLTEEKVSDLEIENMMMRRDLDTMRENMDPSQSRRVGEAFEKSAIYKRIESNLQRGDHFDVEEGEGADSFYRDKPDEEEERFEADKRHVAANRRLKKRKAVYDRKAEELQRAREESDEQLDEPTKENPPDPEEEGSIFDKLSVTTGSVSQGSDHPVMDRPNIIDDALAGAAKRRPLESAQKVLRNLTLLKSRKWEKADARYDDDDECGSMAKADSDDEHIFDDFNPIFDEDVDDSVNYYQMKKWLDYDYDTLVDEMRKRTEQRLNEIHSVWTQDVRNVLCSQLMAAEEYEETLKNSVQTKVDNENERTARNKERLQYLIQGLSEVRAKMIAERHATNMRIAEQQTEEINYLIQESYDKTVNELRASAKFNFTVTQMFFMRSTENDISLVHELHAEQKRLEDNEVRLKAEVDNAKRELAKLEGPLEEEERTAKWIETTVAALMKDMKSKSVQKRENTQLSNHIEQLEVEERRLKTANAAMRRQLKSFSYDCGEITEFWEKSKGDNAFSKRLREMTKINETRVVNLRSRLRSELQVSEPHWRLIRKKVLTDVQRCKKKKWHELIETKAFNELVTQFELRSREHQMNSYIGIDKVAIPYRKTSANVITTFDDKEKVVFNIPGRRKLSKHY